MRGIAVGVGVGFVIGAVVGWLVSESASAGASEASVDPTTVSQISNQYGQIEARVSIRCGSRMTFPA